MASERWSEDGETKSFLTAIVLVVGLLLTGTAFALFRTREAREAVAAYDHQVEDHAILIQERLQGMAESLHTIGRVFQSQEGSTVGSEVAADPTLRHQCLQTVLWLTPAESSTNKSATPSYLVSTVVGRDLAGLGAGADAGVSPMIRQGLIRSRESGQFWLSDAEESLYGSPGRPCRIMVVPLAPLSPAHSGQAFLVNHDPCYVVGVVDWNPFLLAAVEAQSPSVDFIALARPTVWPRQFTRLDRQGLSAAPQQLPAVARFASRTSFAILVAGLLCTALATTQALCMGWRHQTVARQVVERTSALESAGAQLTRELTKVQETEDRLRQSEQILLRAQEIAGLAIGKWDWATDTLTLSEHLWKLYGRPSDLFDGTVEQFINWSPPEERPRLQQIREQARLGHAIPPFEYRVSLPGGAERILRCVADLTKGPEGTPTALICTFQDITASKKIEAELRRQREEYWMIFNLVPALLLHKGADGRILRANEAASTVLGYPVELIEGRRLEELGLILPNGAAEEDREIMSTGRARFGAVEAVWNASGQRFWFEVDKLPYREADGRITGTLVLAQDITERQAARQELQRRNTELNVLYTLTASLSHALRLGQVFGCLKAQLSDQLGVVSGAIATYDPASAGRLRLDICWGLSESALAEHRRRLGSELLPEEPMELKSEAELGMAPEVERHLRIPLLAQGETIGVVDLWVPKRESSTSFSSTFLRNLGLAAGGAVQNALWFSEVVEGRTRLGDLSRRLVDVQEKERRHLAAELHDQIGQSLTALKLSLRGGEPIAEPSLTDRILDDLIQRVRRMSLDLRPAILDDFGLVPAVLWLIEQFSSAAAFPLLFEHSGADRRFTPELETAAYRIVQEGLNNAVRHAQASRIAVRVWANDSGLTVQVSDDGTGFDTEVTLELGGSSGLRGMRERVSLLGGHFQVESAPGKGTRLMASLPLGDRATELCV